MLQRSFKPAKCKTSLKMAVSRIKLLKNKRDAQVKHLKRELAQLLESGQDQTARIRVEHVLREEKTMAAYELVEIYCELIAARLPIIESQKNCPIDLKEAITSVIFASPRCADIPELVDVRKNLTSKYGKEFVNAALELRPDCGVSRLLIEKLSAKAPDGPTKIKILRSIAEEHNVKWEPKSFEERELKPPEDLLNGPNSFEKSSTDYVDHPYRQPSSSHDERNSQLQTYSEQGAPRGQVPHRSVEKTNMPENFYSHSTRTSSYSPNFDHSNVRDNKYGFSEAHLPARGMQDAHTYSLDSSSSPSRTNWNMEFKDATAAAQAAAESAERASMAARAAAELSSRGSATMQYSAELHEPSYVKKNSSSSTLRNQQVAGESAGHLRHENITRQFSAESRKSSDISRDEPQKYASSTMRSHVAGESENISYSQRDSGISHGQIGSYGQDYHSDEDEDLSSIEYKSSSLAQVKPVPASFTARPSFGNLQTEDAYSSQHISETRGDLGHASTGRKDSDKFEIPFTREPPDIRNVDYHEFDDQERSSHDVSYSHTDAYTDDLNIFSNVSQHPGRSYDEDASVGGDRENIQSYTYGIKSYGNASAVFDDYGSDNDEKIIDWEDHHTKQDYGHMDTPSSETLSSPFRDVNSQTRQDKESTRASKGESNVFMEQKNAHVLSISSTRSGHDSLVDELPVTFDDSDGHGSESEEELGRSKLTTVDDGAVVRNQHAASLEVTADFPSAESAEIRQDAVSLVAPSLESGSAVSLEAPSLESGRELNFGTLTGGLRNKGYRLPPYTKVSADRGPTEEKSTKMEHGIDSSVSAGSQPKKVYDRKEIRGTEYNLSSSEDDSKDELHAHTSTSSWERDSRRAGIKENNEAGKEVPIPISDSVEDSPEEPLGHKPRPNVRISRRTKPSPSYPRQNKANTGNVSPEPSVSITDRAVGNIYSSSSHDAEAPRRQIQGNRREIRASLQEPVVSANPTLKPASESNRPSVVETFRSSERKPSQEMSSNQRSGFVLPKFPEKGTNKQVLETKNAGFHGTSGSLTKMVSSKSDQSSTVSSSEGSSRDQPSHVHPKLPDYDTLAARLESLRQNRQ